jgi:hypothetical protein
MIPTGSSAAFDEESNGWAAHRIHCADADGSLFPAHRTPVLPFSPHHGPALPNLPALSA